MKQPYLEVTYRNGKPQAAYLYLALQPGDVSARTPVTSNGMIVDFAADGRAMGIEIPSPDSATLVAVNESLRLANQPPIRSEDLAPLRAA